LLQLTEPSIVVCLSVTVASRAKTAEPIEMPFYVVDSRGPWVPCVRCGPDPPVGFGNFETVRSGHL